MRGASFLLCIDATPVIVLPRAAYRGVILCLQGGEIIMANYDLNVLLNPNLDQSQIAVEKEYIENAVKNGGGTVAQLDEWGNKKLAYQIKKDSQAYFLVYRLNLPEAATNTIQTSLRLRDHVRRVMVVKQRPEWKSKKSA
jgi:small subunit ribosomal protein S6